MRSANKKRSYNLSKIRFEKFKVLLDTILMSGFLQSTNAIHVEHNEFFLYYITKALKIKVF